MYMKMSRAHSDAKEDARSNTYTHEVPQMDNFVLTTCVANSWEQYAHLAYLVASNATQNALVRQEIASTKHAIFYDNEAIEEWKAFLFGVAKLHPHLGLI